jgi:hypothetical protein
MSSGLSASMFGANRAGRLSQPMRFTLSSEVMEMQVPQSMSTNRTTSDVSFQYLNRLQYPSQV